MKKISGINIRLILGLVVGGLAVWGAWTERNEFDHRITALQKEIVELKMNDIQPATDTSCWKDPYTMGVSFGDKVRIQSNDDSGTNLKLVDLRTNMSVPLNAALGPYALSFLGTGQSPRARIAGSIELDGRSLVPGMELQVVQFACVDSEKKFPSFILLYSYMDYCRAHPSVVDVVDHRPLDRAFAQEYGSSLCG